MNKILLLAMLGIALPGISTACNTTYNKSFKELFKDSAAPYNIDKLAKLIGRECDICSSNLTKQDLANTISFVLNKLKYDEALAVANKVFPYLEYYPTRTALDILFEVPLQHINDGEYTFAADTAPWYFENGNYKTWLELIAKGILRIVDGLEQSKQRDVIGWFYDKIILPIMDRQNTYAEYDAFDAYIKYDENTMFDIAKIASICSDVNFTYYVLSNYFDVNAKYGSRNIAEAAREFIDVAIDENLVESKIHALLGYVDDDAL